ncbi:cell wall-binding repeat-containing protein [Candidatus Poriferisodalis sp.]|uniref:cell wall-binding repeat-containing protein n=1 Tax=Candidatus Poriferisodalis sp. TaxID=3101277 RepID=UPI003B02759F
MLWRWLVGLVLVCVVGLVPVGPASAHEHLGDIELERFGGADRYATSLLVAEAVAADARGSLEWVVVVSGRSWHDAVVASSVAGDLEAAILLTPRTGLRPDAMAFLAETGVSNVLVISTGDAVPTAVDEQLTAAGLEVERLGGADQYETSVLAARRRTRGAGHLGPDGVLGQRRGVR